MNNIKTVQLPDLMQCRFCGKYHVLGRDNTSPEICLSGIPEKKYQIGDIAQTSMRYTDESGEECGSTTTEIRILEYISPWDHLEMTEPDPGKLHVFGYDLTMKLPKGNKYEIGIMNHCWIVKVEAIRSSPDPNRRDTMPVSAGSKFIKYRFINESQISKHK